MSATKQGSGSLGVESRTNILPVMKIEEGPGILGPSYDFADNIALPHQVGAVDGSSMESVYNSIGAAAYYVDMIGFGSSSNPLSKDRGVKPLGVNYFVKTGLKCPNGEDMWQYIEGIPKGDALGKRVQAALAGMGKPQLQGLAPGIAEDVKDALNPAPLLNAVFGSGYPECEQLTLRVGDQDGKIRNPDGESYVVDPTSVTYKDGIPYQTRWVHKKDSKGNYINLTKEEWDARKPKKEGFLMEEPSENPVLAYTLFGVIGIILSYRWVKGMASM